MTVTIEDNFVYHGKRQPGYNTRFGVVQAYQSGVGGANYYNSKNFDYFNDSPQVGDYLLLGFRSRFWGMRFLVDVPFAADSVTFVWEYGEGPVYPPTTWTQMGVINGDALTKSGQQDVIFWLPDDATRHKNGKYPVVRCRIAAVSNPTEGGRQGDAYVEWNERCIRATGSATVAELWAAETAGSWTLYNGDVQASLGAGDLVLMPTDGLWDSAARLELTVTGSTTIGSGDTVALTGTDRLGNALTETIDVSGGNGTYKSVGAYRALSAVACTGFTDGTLQVVVERACAYDLKGPSVSAELDGSQQRFIAHLYVGNGVDVSSLTFLRSALVFDYYTMFFVEPAGTLTFGALYTDPLGRDCGTDGCHIMFRYRSQQTSRWYDVVGSGATLRIYGSLWTPYGAGYGGLYPGIGRTAGVPTEFSALDVIATGTRYTTAYPWAVASIGGGQLERVTTTGMSWYWGSPLPAWLDCRNYHNRYEFAPRAPGRLIGGYVSAWHAQVANTTQRQYFQDMDIPDIEKYAFQYTDVHSVTEALTIENTLALTVQDENGGPLVGASVVIEDVFGSEVFNDVTDGNGQITTILKRCTRDLVQGVVQPWQLHTPHTVTITKTGYADRELTLTMDQKRVEVEQMSPPVEVEVPVVVPLEQNVYIGVPVDVPTEVPVHASELAAAIEMPTVSASVAGLEVAAIIKPLNLMATIAEVDIEGATDEIEIKAEVD